MSNYPPGVTGNEPHAAFFWSRVEIGEPDECWPCKNKPYTSGYCRVWWNGRAVAAHRIAEGLARGPIPDGMKVLHTCDNPPCCNPAHLRRGTQSENMREMVARGRHGRRGGSLPGETNANARLTRAEVEEILASSESHRSLGRRYGVSHARIGQIKRGKAWL